MVELFTPSIAIVTQLKKLHHFSHLALETSLQCNCSSKYSAGYSYCPDIYTFNDFFDSAYADWIATTVPHSMPNHNWQTPFFQSRNGKNNDLGTKNYRILVNLKWSVLKSGF